MRKKYNSTILAFIFIVIISFAIEEAIKDSIWFSKLVGMIKTLIENIGEIGLAVATILFVVRWVKISNSNIKNRIEKLEKLKPDKLLETEINESNKISFIVEIVRFSNYRQLETEFKNSDGMIRNFIRGLDEEKKKVKEIMVNKYNYRKSEAEKIINEYYNNYK